MLFVLSNVVFAYTPVIILLQSHRNRDTIGHAIFAGLGAVLARWIISIFNKNKTNKYIRNVLSDTDQFIKTIFRTYSYLILLPNEQEDEGKSASPNAGIIGSQSVKTTIKVGEEIGFNGKIKGRKRYIITDTN
ncbi:MAG: hypothetical protein LBP63_00215 [Prevotellaceae bacterium]|nr:hypothetical protein [Prevotellaceae bacterium]